MRAIVVAAIVAGCAPRVDGPAEQAQRIDRRDADALEHQLAALPGATSAHVVLHRAFRDPFTNATTPASAAILIIATPDADRAQIETAVRSLVAPDMPRPELVIAAAPPLPHPATRQRVLLALLAAIAVAASALAWRVRPRTIT